MHEFDQVTKICRVCLRTQEEVAWGPIRGCLGDGLAIEADGKAIRIEVPAGGELKAAILDAKDMEMVEIPSPQWDEQVLTGMIERRGSDWILRQIVDHPPGDMTLALWGKLQRLVMPVADEPIAR